MSAQDDPTVAGDGSSADGAGLLMQMRLRESHHRIKNNLQVVASLLGIQARASNEPAVREALMDAYRRVLAVARVHDQLQQAQDDATIDAAPFLQSLCRDLAVSFSQHDRLRFVIETDPAELPSETVVTLALVMNELVTNAVKHGCGEDGGEVRISLRRDPPGWRLTVADDGPGLPTGIAPETGREGLGLVQSLVRQLRGTVAVDPTPEGASVTVRFG